MNIWACSPKIDLRYAMLKRIILVLLCGILPASVPAGEDKAEDENSFSFGKGTVRIEGGYSSYFHNKKFFRVVGRSATVWYVKGEVAIEVTEKKKESRDHLALPSFENMVIKFEQKDGKTIIDVDGTEDIFKKRKKEVRSAGEYLKQNKGFNSTNIKSVVTVGMIQPVIVTLSRRRTSLVMRLEGYKEDMGTIGTGQDGRCLTITAADGFQPRVTLVAPEKTALTLRECSGCDAKSQIAAIYVYAKDMGEYRAALVDNANIYVGGEVEVDIGARGQLVLEADGNSVCNVTFGSSGQVTASGNAVVNLSGPAPGKPEKKKQGQKFKPRAVSASQEAVISSSGSAVVTVSKSVKLKEVHKEGAGTVDVK